MTVASSRRTPEAMTDTTTERSSGAHVRFDNLQRRFGATVALAGLSLEIAPGELVALLGPSGCGKTTALRILAGFETADAGAVLLDGADIGRVSAQRRDMGMVFQSYSLFPNMTALDNVGFGLRLRKLGASGRRSRAGELLEMVGLSTHVNRYPHQLSGGQQQRVALARALAIEPRVLLLDEPLSALDAKVRVQLREQIRLIQQQLHMTTLFVTHDQEEALSMADRVGVMREGRLEQIATPTELYDRPATPFVAEFVGTMNRVPANVTAAGKVEVLGRTVPHLGEPRAAGPVDALVRPEGMRLIPKSAGAGIVTAKMFLGPVTRVAVLLESYSVQVQMPSSEAAGIDTGAAVEVTVSDGAVMVDDPRG